MAAKTSLWDAEGLHNSRLTEEVQIVLTFTTEKQKAFLLEKTIAEAQEIQDMLSAEKNRVDQLDREIRSLIQKIQNSVSVDKGLR